MEDPSELMQTGLTIEPVWFDTDVVQYRIKASNGRFSGVTHVYELHDSPRAWAKQLAGFPQRASDRRRMTWGASSPLQAGGFADLQFACIDSAGHAALEIVLVSEWRRSGEAVESAQFHLNITAASLDRFVEQLRTLWTNPPNSAHLTLAT